MKKKNNARARARADVFFLLLFFKFLFLLVSFVNLFKMSNLPCNKISGIVSSYLCKINRGPLRQTWFWNLHHLFWLETVMLCLIVEISAWNRWRSDFNLSVLKTRKVKRVLKSGKFLPFLPFFCSFTNIMKQQKESWRRECCFLILTLRLSVPEFDKYFPFVS